MSSERDKFYEEHAPPSEPQKALSADTDPRLAQYRAQLSVVENDLRRLRQQVKELEGKEQTLHTNIDGVEAEYDTHPRCRRCGARWVGHAGHNGESLFRPRERGMCLRLGPGYYYEAP